MFFVEFSGGESRHSNAGCDYMLAILSADKLTDEQKDALGDDALYGYGPDYELYAEVDPLDYAEEAGMTADELQALYDDGKEAPDAVNDATYDALKEMILEQADKAGISADNLTFEWD